MQNDFNRALSVGLLLTALMGTSQPASFAGFGNMFGSGSGGSDNSSTSNVNRINPTTAPDGTDFISPCAQAKPLDLACFRRLVANAHKNIDRGEKMMQSCGNDHDKVDYRKGKVIKDIGEKDLADLKLNGLYSSDSSLEPDREAKPKAKPDSL